MAASGGDFDSHSRENTIKRGYRNHFHLGADGEIFKVKFVASLHKVVCSDGETGADDPLEEVPLLAGGGVHATGFDDEASFLSIGGITVCLLYTSPSPRD